MEITGKFNNIKASLDRYMYDNFVTTESLTVDWQGSQGIDIEKVDEWVSPRIIGGGKTFVGNISSSTKGWNAEILLNINIFVKKAQLTTNNRLFVLRDTIANYFQLGQTVSIKDYDTGGYPIADTLIVRDIVTDQEVPVSLETANVDNQLLLQYNYTPILNYIRNE